MLCWPLLEPSTLVASSEIPVQATGTGTGFIVHADGYILTAYHVVEDAQAVLVHVGSRSYSAEVLDKNLDQDVALIKIQETSLPVVKIGNASRVARQDSVYVFGFPFAKELGTNLSSNKGHVTAIQTNNKKKIFQIDAAVNPGNSGGPLVNDRGEVIGIVTSKLLVKKAGFTVSEGINFAVPIAQALPMLSHIQDFDFSSIGGGKKELTAKLLDETLSPTVVLISIGPGPSLKTSEVADPLKCREDDSNYSAPFGLCWGMAVADIKNLKTPIKSDSRHNNLRMIEISSAPMTPAETHSIDLIFDDLHGLTKILWSSTFYLNDPYGFAGKQTYDKLKAILTERFGDPITSSSLERTGVRLFKEPNEFYECLKIQGCGMWSSVWKPSQGGFVKVGIEGLGIGKGYVRVVYESADFAKAHHKMKTTQDETAKKAF